ncbi:MAG: pitrilysin family protein [Phenylobacterium sp.]|nr:pitrilysin family protein [Phenylobacterium sp.]
MFRTIRAARLAIVLATAPLLAWVPMGAAIAAEVPPIAFTQRTLPNGLKVIASRDPTTPNVSVQVWYGVGSKDDPQGRSGFAHLFEHLMFKATRNMPAETLDRMTEDVGGFNNASTADDYTDYYEVVPAQYLERILWAEAERMSSLVVDEAIFKSERDVVKEELRQRVLASPYGRLFALYLPQASYTTHPYKRPGIGSIEELEAATIDDVRAFHQTYYRPDNAILIVVGNFDPATLDKWVDRYFAPLKPPAQPLPRVTVKEPPRTGPGVFEGYGPNVPLPAVVLSWQAVAAADPDAPALTVLDAILSAGKSSRLYNSLVYDQQLAVEAFSSADLPRDPGLFMVGAIMSNGKTIAEGEAALLAEVKRLRDAPPTAAELAEAKNELLAGALRERETIDGRGSAIGYAALVDGDPDAVNAALGKLQAVTAADVQRVARTYLAEDRRMSIRYQPESERPPGQAETATPPPPKALARYDGPVFTLAPEDQRVKPPPAGRPIDPVLPKPAETTLPNGLRVIVARSSDLPLVTADLTVRMGAWADPPTLSGAAAMTAGMLTEGTKSRSAQEIASQIESLGASLASGGGLEASSITLGAMPDKLPEALAIMADVARNPAFAAEELDRQRDQALDGLRVALGDPGSVAGLASAPVVFAGTPFGHVAGGTPGSLPRLTPEALAALHAAWFRPDNAILVLTGDIDPQAGFRLAGEAFGDWARPKTTLPPTPTIRPQAAPRAIGLDIPGSGQASVNVLKPSIARADPDYYPALVATSLLGGGYSSRMNQEIRIKRGLSYGASARLSTARTTGSFRASAQTKNESAAEVLDLIRAEMVRLATEPASVDELGARKSSLVGSYGRSLATSAGLASILGDLAFNQISLDEIAAYTARVEAVDPAGVQAFASRSLRPEDASVIVAGDASIFGPVLKAKAPALDVIPVDQIDLDRPDFRRR